MLNELQDAMISARNVYAEQLVKGLMADDMQTICLKCAHLKRLEEAEKEIGDNRDLIATQAETIEALENKIAAQEAIIRADTPASVVDENHPLTWMPTDSERAEYRRIFSHWQHFCACECGCENRVDKPDTLCKRVCQSERKP